MPDAATIADVLGRHAERQPGKRAFVFLEQGEHEAQSLTYSALDRRARAIARTLVRRGLAGCPVILAYPSGTEFVAALFGCFYAGAIAVPAPLASRGNAFTRIRAIQDDSGASAILSSGDWGDDGETGQIPREGIIATEELDDPGEGRFSPGDPSGLALLQYTSGSTGNPRGVMLTHGNLMDNQRHIMAGLGTTETDTAVNWLPLYHDMGLIGGVLHAIYVGGTTILMSPLAFLQRPLRWLQAISRYRATISMAPSFAFDLCAQRALARPTGSPLDLSSWRVAVCGGEPVRPPQLESFIEVFGPAGFDGGALTPAYGLAESTVLATCATPGKGLLKHDSSIVDPLSGASVRSFACCGLPSPGQRLAIVDPVTCRRLPAGKAGEIWLAGGSVAQGYWNRPEETAASFGGVLADEPAAGPWLRTGDLGFLSRDGLIVTGRLKEMLVIRGANYDPLDIETTARASDPALSAGSGAAFALDSDGGEVAVLLHEADRSAVREGDASSIAGNVIEAVSRTLGLTLYDLVLIRPGTLPRTTSGKTQRHLCRELYLTDRLVTFAPVAHPGLGRCRPQQRTPAQ